MKIHATIAAIAALSAPSIVDARCHSRDVLIATLQDRFSEVHVAGGLTQDGSRFVEVFASDTTGSWTILYTTPDGVSCVLASGTGYTTIPAGAPT